MKDFDETILERIVALSEMFPVCVQVSLSSLYHLILTRFESPMETF
jgi:hypothetical protein